MTDKEKPPFKVVVGYDLSEQAQLALGQALDLAANRLPSVIHAIGVLGGRQGLKAESGGGKSFESAQELQDQIQASAEELIAERNLGDGIHLFVHTRIGDVKSNAANEIVGLSREVAADMIIVGTHGRKGLKRLVMGSVAEEVVRKAGCPVLVSRPQDYETTEEVEFAPEPACEDCVAKRKETNGAEWWCERHAGPSVQVRRYAVGGQKIVQMRPDEWALW